MIEKECVLYLFLCIALFFSLECPAIANDESLDRVILQTDFAEYCGLLRTHKGHKGEDFSTDCENEIESRTASSINKNAEIREKCSDFAAANKIVQEEETPQEKSPDVIMTTLTFTQEIYINQNQVMEVWSQNISSQTRRLFHRLYVRYPDGNVFSSESTHIDIHPGLSLWTQFTVSNVGKGIGLFDFSCEVWEETSPSANSKHDEKSNRYWAKFYKPPGVSANYYCDDTWHHPSDSRVYETALLVSGGATSPRDAVIALMHFVNNYVTPDPIYETRTSDIMDRCFGDSKCIVDIRLGA